MHSDANKQYQTQLKLYILSSTCSYLAPCKNYTCSKIWN